MKRLAVMAIGLAIATASVAQKLPRTSPLAEVEQTVGLTDIEIQYSRPGVKDRTIFGDVVPYGEMWRVGANERTTIETEDNIKIEGKELKAGKYAILVKPGKDTWQVMFSSNIESWGTNDYDPKDDVLTITVKPEEAQFTENMLFYFDEVVWDKANLVLQWDKVKIRIPIEVDVDTKAWAGIEEAIAKNPKDAMVLRNAARYCADSGKRLDKGLKFIQEANEIKSSWLHKLIEARIYAAKKEYDSAKSSAKEAIKLGEEEAKESGKEFSYKRMIESEMTKWK